MVDITSVMLTVDRSPSSNYLATTLRNLLRSDLATSRRLNGLYICDSKKNGWANRVASKVLRGKYANWFANGQEDLCANLNAARALELGGDAGCEWVLFLEDDIDVCSNFFESVGAWLDDHARDDRRIYSIAHPLKLSPKVSGGLEYPIGNFYGTQAFAVRKDDATSLSGYIRDHAYDRSSKGVAYDLLMHDWSRVHYRHLDHFLAVVPAMADHIGKESIIRPRDVVHNSPSWGGRDYSYVDRKARK